ncbi:3-dehydroquinate dehydratase, type I [Actinomyces viscosus C505]|uniref:3-dehydroquinate dehydratase n=1 Tax=Actinomyces viscosus C505 TaxID=562973 RepID=F2UWB4_ACTVI|nr:3-dehydroquinate dehydratase, type I [Actinomyces viscosus C505]
MPMSSSCAWTCWRRLAAWPPPTRWTRLRPPPRSWSACGGWGRPLPPTVLTPLPAPRCCSPAAPPPRGAGPQLDDASYGALLRSVLDGLADWAPERRPAAIDVEVQRDCLPQVCEQAHGLGIDVVASFHDFEATPADEVLEEVLARMAREGADLAKIAVWPTSAHDVARLLGVCARATAGARERSGLGVPVAAMSMGALGAVSRVAPTFGSALTFAVVPDEQGQARASAPGQLPIQDVRRCLELLRV